MFDQIRKNLKDYTLRVFYIYGLHLWFTHTHTQRFAHHFETFLPYFVEHNGEAISTMIA